MSYVPPMMISLVLLGIWGFLSKLAGDRLTPATAMLADGAGHLTVVAIVIVLLMLTKGRIGGDAVGWRYGMLTGVAGATSMIFFFAALRLGPASVIVPITGTYPAISAVFAILLLREPVDARTIAGIVCSMVAVLLLAR